MRIIAGEFRGRPIKAVPGQNTRPTLDKVKESVFNALGQFFDGGNVLDLYAGSGNLGLEALSRGYEHIIFVDKSFQAINTIKENIRTLRVENQTEVLKMSDMGALAHFKSQQKRFDLVFLDPPYKKQRLNTIMENLVNENLLNDLAIVVCETLKEDDLVEEIGDFKKSKEYIYGITKITLYQKEGANHE
jgi:16S rRNA (guanine966-N2)-methyltransferase